jgi:predicted RNA-binding protein with PIN domain
MAQHVIVDGYNVLGVLHAGAAEQPFAGEASREGLLRDLSTYHARKGHPLTVVFDGWKEGMPVERREFRSGVEVIYSRRGERADQVIQRLANQLGRDCAVVSSDREVADCARQAGAFVMGAAEFAVKLRAGSSSQMTSSWRKENAGDLDDDRRRRPHEKKGNPRKLPKVVRARQRKLRGF